MTDAPGGNVTTTEVEARKKRLARMLREKADHWHQMASRHHDNPTAVAVALAYRAAYNDAASLIEFGEVAW